MKRNPNNKVCFIILVINMFLRIAADRDVELYLDSNSMVSAGFTITGQATVNNARYVYIAGITSGGVVVIEKYNYAGFMMRL